VRAEVGVRAAVSHAAPMRAKKAGNLHIRIPIKTTTMPRINNVSEDAMRESLKRI
jgi:hypothetical protein